MTSGHTRARRGLHKGGPQPATANIFGSPSGSGGRSGLLACAQGRSSGSAATKPRGFMRARRIASGSVPVPRDLSRHGRSHCCANVIAEITAPWGSWITRKRLASEISREGPGACLPVPEPASPLHPRAPRSRTCPLRRALPAPRGIAWTKRMRYNEASSGIAAGHSPRREVRISTPSTRPLRHRARLQPPDPRTGSSPYLSSSPSW
jgi:hypothetical protein